MLNFYVYAYIREKDSKISKAGTPYYIGKGKGNRAWNHLKNDAILTPKSTQIIILENNLTELGAFALERRYIRWYGRIDNGTGILRNKTDGGQGGSFWKGKKRPNCKRRKKDTVSISGKCTICNADVQRTYSCGNKLRLEPIITCSSHKCRGKLNASTRKGIKVTCLICFSEISVYGFPQHVKFCTHIV